MPSPDRSNVCCGGRREASRRSADATAASAHEAIEVGRAGRRPQRHRASGAKEPIFKLSSPSAVRRHFSRGRERRYRIRHHKRATYVLPCAAARSTRGYRLPSSLCAPNRSWFSGGDRNLLPVPCGSGAQKYPRAGVTDATLFRAKVRLQCPIIDEDTARTPRLSRSTRLRLHK